MNKIYIYTTDIAKILLEKINSKKYGKQELAEALEISKQLDLLYKEKSILFIKSQYACIEAIYIEKNIEKHNIKDISKNKTFLLFYAEKTKNITDQIMQKICKKAYDAFNFALDIDKCSRDYTREIACKDPYYAYRYAKDVDKCPRDDTREAACKDPEFAYWYAVDIDKCPKDDTREAACKDPEFAYLYAVDIDKCSRIETREASFKNSRTAWEYMKRFNDYRICEDVLESLIKMPEYFEKYLNKIEYNPLLKKYICKAKFRSIFYAMKKFPQIRKDPKIKEALFLSAAYAFNFAKDIDKCPRDDTRIAASNSPINAYYYAIYIDKQEHLVTWAGVQNSEYEKEYIQFFLRPMKNKII